MATVPNQIVKFTELEIDAFSTIAQATWQKAAGIIEYANKSFPMGMLLFFYASQENLPEQPDPKYWKYCDGSTIVNANSIYNGVASPDLRGRFFKHPGTGDTFPILDGSDTINIAHDHGGFTGPGADFGETQLDNGEERAGAFGTHIHSIASSSGVITIIPAYREAQVFMRIC